MLHQGDTYDLVYMQNLTWKQHIPNWRMMHRVNEPQMLHLVEEYQYATMFTMKSSEG